MANSYSDMFPMDSSRQMINSSLQRLERRLADIKDDLRHLDPIKEVLKKCVEAIERTELNLKYVEGEFYELRKSITVNDTKVGSSSTMSDNVRSPSLALNQPDQVVETNVIPVTVPGKQQEPQNTKESTDRNRTEMNWIPNQVSIKTLYKKWCRSQVLPEKPGLTLVPLSYLRDEGHGSLGKAVPIFRSVEKIGELVAFQIGEERTAYVFPHPRATFKDTIRYVFQNMDRSKYPSPASYAEIEPVQMRMRDDGTWVKI